MNVLAFYCFFAYTMNKIVCFFKLFASNSNLQLQIKAWINYREQIACRIRPTFGSTRLLAFRVFIFTNSYIVFVSLLRH